MIARNVLRGNIPPNTAQHKTCTTSADHARAQTIARLAYSKDRTRQRQNIGIARAKSTPINRPMRALRFHFLNDVCRAAPFDQRHDNHITAIGSCNLCFGQLVFRVIAPLENYIGA